MHILDPQFKSTYSNLKAKKTHTNIYFFVNYFLIDHFAISINHQLSFILSIIEHFYVNYTRAKLKSRHFQNENKIKKLKKIATKTFSFSGVIYNK